MRHKPEVKEGSGLLEADDFRFILDESSDV
jgi:hypothetical protein